ncbi:MAG: sensory rhodopsin transducer [Candidatus Macondimonas sp.]
MASHETVCILNCSDSDAQVKITIFFADRGPAGPYEVPARRTRHVRFNDLQDPAPIPRDTDYTSLIESAVPLSVSTPGWTRGKRLWVCSTIACKAE